MRLPLQITFRHFAHSDTVENDIRERAAKLDRFYPNIMGCRVAIDLSQRKRTTQSVFHARVDLTVPGEELVGQHDDEDVHVAIKQAFLLARRELQEYARRHRGDVKLHDGPPHGRVSRVFPDEGYGFLTTTDGREIYFHENAVLNDGWKRIEVGDEVRYAEEEGEEGPQASTVALVGAGKEKNAA